MTQTLRKLDVHALTASRKASEKLSDLLKGLKEDVALALSGATSTIHKGSSVPVVVANATATLTTLMALANDEKAKVNAHVALTGIGGAHLVADATNVVTSADATDHPTTVTLLTELKTDLEAHDTQAGVHLNNDTISIAASVGQGVLFDLLNELKVDYEAHRVLTAGSVHGAADSTNVLSAADAADQATAITLANDLRTQYEAHRVLTAASVHGAEDTTDVITAPVATDLASVLILANDLRAQYEAHRVLTAGSVHGGADSTNTVTEAATAELSAMATLANELKTDFNAHAAKVMNAFDIE
jgi:hypothetical protein